MATELVQRMTEWDSLHAAWARVRKGGRSPGVDGVSLAEFEANHQGELFRLRHEIRHGTYKPWPALRVGIPKPDGDTRLIGIQAVRDRVAQRALLNLILPAVEAELEDCSFAYRPARSVAKALARVDAFRRDGFIWAARSDVRLCFDSLERKGVLRSLAEVTRDPGVRSLTLAWLSAGVMTTGGAWNDPGIGVSQGDVLSPVLCNLYLDPFDEAVLDDGHPMVRYADDFVVLGRTRKEAEAGLAVAGRALEDLGLRINEAKSRVTTFVGGFEYLGAALVGSMILPLHRVERPGKPPRFTFGYGPPAQIAAGRPRPPALAGTERGVQRRLQQYAAARQAGREIPAMAEAFLRARDSDAPPEPTPNPHRAGWESVFLI